MTDPGHLLNDAECREATIFPVSPNIAALAIECLALFPVLHAKLLQQTATGIPRQKHGMF